MRCRKIWGSFIPLSFSKMKSSQSNKPSILKSGSVIRKSGLLAHSSAPFLDLVNMLLTVETTDGSVMHFGLDWHKPTRHREMHNSTAAQKHQTWNHFLAVCLRMKVEKGLHHVPANHVCATLVANLSIKSNLRLTEQTRCPELLRCVA